MRIDIKTDPPTPMEIRDHEMRLRSEIQKQERTIKVFVKRYNILAAAVVVLIIMLAVSGGYVWFGGTIPAVLFYQVTITLGLVCLILVSFVKWCDNKVKSLRQKVIFTRVELEGALALNSEDPLWLEIEAVVGRSDLAQRYLKQVFEQGRILIKREAEILFHACQGDEEEVMELHKVSRYAFDRLHLRYGIGPF